MEKIFKYEIEEDEVEIKMPKGALILTVQTQRGLPCMWAIADPNAEMEIRTFEVFATGEKIEVPLGELTYIGTYQTKDGIEIYHLFEKTGTSEAPT